MDGLGIWKEFGMHGWDVTDPLGSSTYVCVASHGFGLETLLFKCHCGPCILAGVGWLEPVRCRSWDTLGAWLSRQARRPGQRGPWPHIFTNTASRTGKLYSKKQAARYRQ